MFLDTLRKLLIEKDDHLVIVFDTLEKKINQKIPSYASIIGSELHFSKSFTKLSIENQYCLLLHELLHVFLKHIDRSQGRIPQLWNLAADCAINSILLPRLSTFLRNKLILPEMWNLPINKSAEWYYAVLGKLDIAIDIPHIWAATNKQNDIDWKLDVKSFCHKCKKRDPKKLSRRFDYALGKSRDNKEKLLIALDCSSSISPYIINSFVKEIEVISSSTDQAMDVVQSDYEIRNISSIENFKILQQRPCHETRFSPVFNLLKNGYSGLVYLTDGNAVDVDQIGVAESVIWVYPGFRKAVVPWGIHRSL